MVCNIMTTQCTRHKTQKLTVFRPPADSCACAWPTYTHKCTVLPVFCLHKHSNHVRVHTDKQFLSAWIQTFFDRWLSSPPCTILCTYRSHSFSACLSYFYPLTITASSMVDFPLSSFSCLHCFTDRQKPQQTTKVIQTLFVACLNAGGR